MFHFMGFLALVPVVMLLTVSFFVLFTIKKYEVGNLKVFGWIIAVLLWVVAALVFSAGMITVAGGHAGWGGPCGAYGRTPSGCAEMMKGMGPGMMQPGHPGMMEGMGPGMMGTGRGMRGAIVPGQPAPEKGKLPAAPENK